MRRAPAENRTPRLAVPATCGLPGTHMHVARGRSAYRVRFDHTLLSLPDVIAGLSLPALFQWFMITAVEGDAPDYDN